MAVVGSDDDDDDGESKRSWKMPGWPACRTIALRRRGEGGEGLCCGTARSFSTIPGKGNAGTQVVVAVL